MYKALKLRLDRGETQEEVQEATGVTRLTIRKIESYPSYHPRPATLKKLADYYGVKASELRQKPSEHVYLKPGDVVPDGVMAFIVRD